jgi:hypothetical protein
VWTLTALGATPIASAQAPGPATSAIEVVSTVDPEPPAGCRPGREGWSYATEHDETTFVLRVTTPAPPCAPVTAVAAVYAMPGGAATWPQTLRERREVVIDRAGVTEFRFTKACEPVQFDVVTGPTPDSIAPWADSHGPLLFPGDLRTAHQHRPARGCGTTTTVVPVTAAPTSAVATSAAPTTAVPTTDGPDDSTPGDSTDVGGITTLSTPGPGDTTSTTLEVLGTSQGRSETPLVAGLALTGTSVLILTATGVLVTLVGIALVWWGTRRGGRSMVIRR